MLLEIIEVYEDMYIYDPLRATAEMFFLSRA